jgi:hypothetical protein
MISTDQNNDNSVNNKDNMDSITESESNKDRQLKNAMSIAGMYVAIIQNQNRCQQAEQTQQNIIDILLILLTSNPFSVILPKNFRSVPRLWNNLFAYCDSQ